MQVALPLLEPQGSSTAIRRRRLMARQALSNLIHEQLAAERRASLGQVLTPWNVADYLARLLMEAPGSFVDAGAGYGMLSDASNLRGVIINPNQATLVDMDPHMVEFLRANPPIPGATVLETDFITWSLREATAGRTRDYCVMNPPYLSGLGGYDTGLVDIVNQHLGTNLTKLTNLFGLFLLCGANLLRPGGRTVVLIPTEIFTTNFGANLIRTLPSHIQLRQVHLFDDANEPFLAQGVVSCVLVLESSTVVEDTQVFDVRGGADEDLEPSFLRTVDHQELVDNPKSMVMGLLHRGAQGVSTLGEFFQVSRGMATGENELFMVTDEERRLLDPEGRVTFPCIKNVGYTDTYWYTAQDHAASIAAGHPEWQIRVEDLDAAPPLVQKRLLEAQRQGLHKQPMLAQRSPWFKQERHQASPLLLPGMYRDHARILVNSDLVPTLTTFHRALPKEGVTLDQVAFLAAWFNTKTGQDCFRQMCRRLGNRSFRLTPRDAMTIMVPNLNLIPAASLQASRSELEAALRSRDHTTIETLVDRILDASGIRFH